MEEKKEPEVAYPELDEHFQKIFHICSDASAQGMMTWSEVRSAVVALLMHKLDMPLEAIGYVARELVAIEMKGKEATDSMERRVARTE